jgi:hypothetical protein
VALNATGPISLAGTTSGQSIALELGRSGTAQISLNDTDVRSLLGITSGSIAISSAYGKSATPPDPGGGVLVVDNQTAGFVGVGRTGYHNENVNYTDIQNQGPFGPYPDALNITGFATNISRLYRGYKYIYTTGTYRFRLTSDDGAYMWIGPTAISGYSVANSYINNGGLHGPVAVTGGFLTLTAGFFYPIRIVYGNSGGTSQITLEWEGPGVAFTTSLTNRAFRNSATNGF